MDKLVEIFCDVDDFCKVFLPEWEKSLIETGERKRKRQCRLSPSEIMSIIILFHRSNYKDFKNFYTFHMYTYLKKAYPKLLNYTRFIEVMPRVLVPLCGYLSHLKGKPTGISFEDSTSLKVCHNLRIPRHKVFNGIAARSKGTIVLVLWFQVASHYKSHR